MLTDVKCDQIKTGCSQCLRADKACPGYRDLTKLLFRDENETVLRKVNSSKDHTGVQGTRKVVNLLTPRTTSPENKSTTSGVTWKSLILRSAANSQPLYKQVFTGIEDEGINFFFANYITASSRTKTWKINPSQSPLWESMRNNLILCNAVSAVGLAGLSNVRKSQTHMIVARKKYAVALHEVISILDTTDSVDLNTTFKAVTMLAAFEIVSGTSEAADGWGAHIGGAASLLPMINARYSGIRAVTRIQTQMFFSVMIKCITKAERVPQSLERWCADIRKLIHLDDAPVADLISIAVRLVNLHASTQKTDSFIDSSDVAEEASRLEIELGHWENSLPINWRFSVIPWSQDSEDIYNGHIHVYQDLWTARVWNNYRQTRIRVNEMFLVHADSLRKLGKCSNEDRVQRGRCLATISRIAEDTCASVSCQFHHDANKKLLEQRASQASGAYLILCPLVVAASAIGVSKAIHDFAARRLETIGKTKGIQQALYMAERARINRARWETARLRRVQEQK
ncbi:C6 zinc finger protein [Glarea lozoyensis ATCC 20868]|uniref:C6 zinc finger protein n=1 Tax=Glarea lozoyensis (strain ATCC 20868 / MF5171) TaxID=1116229 RepID=S3DJY1_GLAL2|nr:C6 zinc finger protein [Glarea lozoyensis ATCC 20868]EPE32351.1 C6 zinc finger protein [Glarea lozoyensis ATCC 20868]